MVITNNKGWRIWAEFIESFHTYFLPRDFYPASEDTSQVRQLHPASHYTQLNPASKDTLLDPASQACQLNPASQDSSFPRHTIRGVTETGVGFGYVWFGNQPIKTVSVTEIRKFSRQCCHLFANLSITTPQFCILKLEQIGTTVRLDGLQPVFFS